MKYKIFIYMFSLFMSYAYADAIYSIHGFVYHNVKVIDTTKDVYGFFLKYKYFDTGNGSMMVISLPIEEVLKWEITEFDSTRGIEIETLQRTVLTDSVSTIKHYNAKKQIVKNPYPVYYKEYPNRYFLIVSTISLGLTWDYFSRSNNIQKQIDINTDLAKKIYMKVDNSALESEKTRVTVIGVVCAAATIASLIYSFQSIEIKSNGKTLSMVYYL